MSKSTADALGNPWFSVSVGLGCLIAGFFIGQSYGGMPAAAAPTPSVPTVADAPAPTQPTVAGFPVATNVKQFDPASDYVSGDADATITIIEYSDYECPFCARVHDTLKQLVVDYDGDVNWVVRNFPLSFHPNAQKSAEGALCAGELGGNDAFWAYGDVLFSKGANINNLVTYAEEIGLNAAAFQECLDSGKYEDLISTDIAEGSTAGVTGTPGNIVCNNDTQECLLVSGAQPIDQFKSAIDSLL